MLNDSIKLLKILNENREQIFTQRAIAKKLGISLGKVNSLIKQLVEEEFIIIEKDYSKSKKNSDYKLTNKGLEELALSIKKVKDLRINIHDEGKKVRAIKTAVILGAGYKIGVEKPLGFIEVAGETVIEKILKKLRENNIEKIIIVAGYRKEYYLNLAKKNEDIKVVINEDFEKTGSMKSLALCKDFIDEDFVLIENDLVFEDKALVNLLNNKSRDCILITDISGNGHEVFVEVRGNHLFKFSKDIHAFNKIDGEIIGITKISKKLYTLMLEEYSNNLNPYIHYEHTMLDVTRYYKVAYEKIEKLEWLDISTTII